MTDRGLTKGQRSDDIDFGLFLAKFPVAHALYPFPSSPTIASDSSPAPRSKSLCSSPSLEKGYEGGSFGQLCLDIT